MADFPEVIGKYKIVSLVAKGGMGAVYKAEHPTLKRHVIIKKLTIRGNAVMIERFKREAQILMDLDDARIVRLFDYFKEGTSHYIVLEFVDGCSLDSLIKKRRYVSGPVALYVFLEACKALKYAHDKGIIHRDIKPGNILISKSGVVKLADFGIAVSDETQEDALTKEGTTLGTASYMPPEQFKNSKNVDKRADIYAMGVMLYEMLTGKRPFPGNFAPETIVLIQKGRYVNPKRINPDIPKIARKLIKRMIQPNPKRRVQDIGQVARALERVMTRYPRDAIRDSLALFVSRDNAEEPTFKPRTMKRVAIPAALIAVAALAYGGYRAWDSGTVHRRVLASSFGEIRVEVRVSADVKDRADAFVRARVFEHDGKDYPEIPGSPLVLEPSSQEDGRWHTFASKPIYAKPGRYRVKVMAEGRVFWKTITVRSFAEQNERGESGEGASFTLDAERPRPLAIRTETSDAANGRNINSSSRHYALVGQTWTRLSEVPEGAIAAPGIVKVKAECDGYYPEEYSLKIAPYQDELSLQFELMPLPGTLTLSAPQKKIHLLVNGKRSIPLGGKTFTEESVEGFAGGTKTWPVVSGRYEIQAGLGRKAGRFAFDVKPGEETRISIIETDGVYQLYKE